MNTGNDEGPVTELDERETWELLASQRFGRLAYTVAGTPEIVPVNYVTSNGRLYFRTGEGSKLFAVALDGKVAFEIDVIGEDEARSVVVHGTAHELVTDEEHEMVAGMGLRSWVPTYKFHDIEVVPDEVTGRRFHLGAEPPLD